MANTGTKVADKVADEAFNIAEKTDDIKNKVHSYANNIKNDQLIIQTKRGRKILYSIVLFLFITK